MGLGDDFSGEMKPLAEVLYALGRERVVVPLPRKLRLDVAAGCERLERLDHLEVGNVELLMLGSVEVFFRYENTLCVRAWDVGTLHELSSTRK